MRVLIKDFKVSDLFPLICLGCFIGFYDFYCSSPWGELEFEAIPLWLFFQLTWTFCSMNTHRLELSSGTDLKNSIENFCKESNINGFILGVIGDLSHVVFQCPKRKNTTSFKGHLEIITLWGFKTLIILVYQEPSV